MSTARSTPGPLARYEWVTPRGASCSVKVVRPTPTRRRAAATAAPEGDRSGEPTTSSAADPPATPNPNATTRSSGRFVPDTTRTTASTATAAHRVRDQRGPSQRTTTTTDATAPAR